MNTTYNYKTFYKEEMDTPNKYNTVYLDFLSGLQAQYPELDKAGIYGIYFNGSLLYIGQATNICKRWIAHCFNWTHEFSESYHSNKYTALRHLTQLGEVEFAVIQTVESGNIKGKLDALEGSYIRKAIPLLNRKIPNEYGRGYINHYWTIRELKELTGLTSSEIADMKAELVANNK